MIKDLLGLAPEVVPLELQAVIMKTATIAVKNRVNRSRIRFIANMFELASVDWLHGVSRCNEVKLLLESFAPRGSQTIAHTSNTRKPLYFVSGVSRVRCESCQV